MKKVVLFAALAVTSFTLFSFRNVENKTNNAEVTEVTEFAIAAANFSESSETFPDKFTKWRKNWTDYDTIEQMNMSLDEMNKALKSF